MRRRKVKSMLGVSKRAIVTMLSLAMVAQPLGVSAATVSGNEAVAETTEKIEVTVQPEATVQSETKPEAETKGAIDFTKATTEFYGGWDGSGVEAAVSSVSANSVTIDASNFGYAANEWSLQYMVKNLELPGDVTYQVEFDITSSVDKKVFFKIGEEAGIVSTTLSLNEDEKKHYSGTTSAVNTSGLTMYFAMGQFSGETPSMSGSVKIENVRLWTDEEIIIDTTKGNEYDFDVEDRVSYADPGKEKPGYDLIWSDEFDGNYPGANVDSVTGLNLDNWACQLGDGSTDCGNYGWGNNELQAYTNRLKNVGVNEDLGGTTDPDGMLRITGSYEADGYSYGTESSKKYTSARLRTTKATDELFNMTYGYIESRMSLPATKGAWPAFWMLPQSTDIYGFWPVSGEIDIMETCGVHGNKACSTLHWGAPSHVYKGSGYTDLTSDFTYFHTYAVDWEPGKMTFYYDGEEIYQSSSWKSGFSGASDTLGFDAPYDQPYYMLLNLAIDSGQFGGAANKATFQDDINMYVDYVRAYQKSTGYPDSVTKTASGSVKDDWTNYAGRNQIAEIGTENLMTNVADGNINGVETGKNVDKNSWYLGYQSDASDVTATAYTDDAEKKWAKVGINTKGAKDYSIQLIGHYDAKAGYVYKVSYDAYADGGMIGKKVNCDSKEWSGWSTYGVQEFTLTDTPASYSYLIDQTEDFENCRIEFNLGAQASGNVYIGNVKVEIVDPAFIEREAANRKPMANGNIIYNGTFDQGNHHVGYWSASEGTTLSVPRYTTEKIAESDVSVVDVASKTNYEDIADGVKYYERRAQVSATATPEIYQADLTMPADEYNLKFDVYSKSNTTLTASIREVEVTGEGDTAVKTLGDVLTSQSFNYTAADGVKSNQWKFTTDKAIANAALVLTFADGASVQVDNVSMIGASLKEQVDKTPIDADTTWNGDNGGGTALNVVKENDIYTLSDITSGGSWYAPQIVSNDFKLTTGNEYKLSFQYKMTGTSNNTAQYIVQENGGSWTVFGGGPTTFTYDVSKADADGFCTYTATIPATVTLSGVHMVFGLGNSGADGNLAFSFKNVKLTLAGEETEDPKDPVTPPAKPPVAPSGDEKDKNEKVVATGIAIEGISKKLAAGKKVQLSAAVLPETADQSVTWASSNEKYATVSASGKISLKKAGAGKHVTITATAKDGSGVTASYKIKIVKDAVKKVKIKTSTKSLKAGKRLKLKAEVTTSGKSANKAVKWTCSNIKYATVSKSGKVRLFGDSCG